MKTNILTGTKISKIVLKLLQSPFHKELSVFGLSGSFLEDLIWNVTYI